MKRSHKIKAVCLAASLLWIIPAGWSHAEPASIQGLGTLGDSYFTIVYPGSLSADGQVVVGRSDSAQPIVGIEAFRWTAETGMISLVEPGGAIWPWQATGVSADGSIVTGLARVLATGGHTPYLWTEAGGVENQPEGGGGRISDDGSVLVGVSDGEASIWTQTEGWTGLGIMYPVVDCYGPYSTASSCSWNGSVIAGYNRYGYVPGSDPENPCDGARSLNEAFRWTAEDCMVGLGFLPGAESSQANDVSAYDGSVVVGSCRYPDDPEVLFPEEAFRWTETEGMAGLGFLAGGDPRSWANGVSADGSVVVGYSDSDTGQEAFIWYPEFGMRKLSEMLVKDFGLDLRGWYIYEAVGISDDGLTICGKGFHYGEVEAWIATIPELPMPRYLYVDDISMTKSVKKTVQATATITIKEVDGSPVQDAIVYAHWSGMTSDIDSGITNKKGKVSFASDTVKENGTFTITVDDVVKYGWIYDSDSNNETSDSI